MLRTMLSWNAEDPHALVMTGVKKCGESVGVVRLKSLVAVVNKCGGGAAHYAELEYRGPAFACGRCEGV